MFQIALISTELVYILSGDYSSLPAITAKGVLPEKSGKNDGTAETMKSPREMCNTIVDLLIPSTLHKQVTKQNIPESISRSIRGKRCCI